MSVMLFALLLIAFIFVALIAFYLAKITRDVKKPQIEEFKAKAMCPYCMIDILEEIQKASKRASSTQFKMKCSICEGRSLWDVTGYPPMLVQKIAPPPDEKPTTKKLA